MGYYLMIKTINQSGVRYLCKCKDDKDHIAYKGSGVFWWRLLKAHPEYTLTTTVLGHYATNELLREAGIYYSNLYNVVQSKEWANCVVEMGDGGDTITGRIFAYCADTKEEKTFINEVNIPEGWIKGRKPKGPRPAYITDILVAVHTGKKRSEETCKNMRDSVRGKRMTIQCKQCDRQVTLQNIKRHMEKTHGM